MVLYDKQLLFYIAILQFKSSINIHLFLLKQNIKQISIKNQQLMYNRQEEYESDCAVKMDFDQQASELEYKRKLGAYRPHFESIPQDYHPNTWCEAIGCFLLVVLIMGGGLGLMIALLLWDFAWKTPKFVLFWSIVFAAFIVILLLLIFFGGRAKIRNNRKIVHQKLSKIHIDTSQNEDRQQRVDNTVI